MSSRVRIFSKLSLLAVLGLLASLLVIEGSASAARTERNASSGQSAEPVVTATTYTNTFDFTSAFDTHTFTVRMGQGASVLRAQTRDCCIEGDHWGVFVSLYGSTPTGVSNPNASNCGTGRTSVYSGAAALTGRYLAGKTVQVVVTHCSGVSRFPAGLTLQLSSNAQIVVTRRT